jgi:BirA family transcriptional regulator, biotin operon repressor / biotin---[acetyl-CoA-carboxylase] ligase
MLAPPDRFAPAARPGRRIGHRVEEHASIGSTNDRARELLEAVDGAGVAIVAEQQRAGRGRRGRTWQSPPGLNLAMSVGIRPALAAGEAWKLGLAAALAARDACREVADVRLKWPNDLVAPDGRKLGGLLVETAIDGDALTGAVIGIGINVNWRVAQMPAPLSENATSLAERAGGDVDRVALLSRLLAALDAEVAAVEAGASLLARYRAACTTIGGPVTVDVGTGLVAGEAIDLDDHGRLVVSTTDGIVTIATGEVIRARAEAFSR